MHPKKHEQQVPYFILLRTLIDFICKELVDHENNLLKLSAGMMLKLVFEKCEQLDSQMLKENMSAYALETYRDGFKHLDDTMANDPVQAILACQEVANKYFKEIVTTIEKSDNDENAIVGCTIYIDDQPSGRPIVKVTFKVVPRPPCDCVEKADA